MNWLKVITRSGRQSLAKELMKKYVTPRSIAGYATEAVSRTLKAGTAKLTPERLKTLVHGTAAIADAAGRIADAVNPDGNGGTEITADEATAISGTLQVGLNLVLTQDALDALIEKAVTYVP